MEKGELPVQWDQNARAFLEQLDRITPADVTPERIATFTSENDFNGLVVELLIEVGSLACVAGSLLPAETRRWNRNQAILGGHVVRLYKLISALLDQICQRQREITFIVARLAAECIINLRFLLRFGDDATFDSYVTHSLRQEKRLHDRICKAIEERGGEVLPVEERMLTSIGKAVRASGFTTDELSASRPKQWADMNLYDRADAIGLGGTYLGVFGGPSSSVHGNWGDLLEFQLETDHEAGTFAPILEWHHPRPQIGETVAFLAVEAIREYFDHVGEGPVEFLEHRLDDLSDRIGELPALMRLF